MDWEVLSDAGTTARFNGCASSLWVSGNPANWHVDPVTGCGALFFAFATPKTVFAVIASPVSAVVYDWAHRTNGTGFGFPNDSSFRSLTRRCEKQTGLADARCIVHPFEDPAEYQVAQSLSCHDQYLLKLSGRRAGGWVGGSAPDRTVLATVKRALDDLSNNC